MKSQTLAVRLLTTKDDLVPATAIDNYVAAAKANNVPVSYLVLADAVPGFDCLQDTPASQDAVRQTLEFMQKQLLTTK